MRNSWLLLILGAYLVLLQVEVEVFAGAAQLSVFFGSESRQRIEYIPDPAIYRVTADPERGSYFIGPIVTIIVEYAHCLLCRIHLC